MTETGARPRRRNVWKYLLLVLAGGLILLAAMAWYATTGSFQALVRHRLVSELQRITGGRVELGGFHVIPFRFRVSVSDLTIHGEEAADQVPFWHVDRLEAKVKLVSVLGAELGFDSLLLEAPVIHIITYPDGTTNQPQPQARRTAGENPIEKLFSLSIGRIDVRRGTFLWNERRIPLDFSANDISATLAYSFLRRRYDGDLLLGRAETTFADFRPLAWMLETHFDLSQDNLDVRSLLLTSGRSKVEASGNVKDFREPSFAGAYKVTLDLGQAGAVARCPELRGGTLQAEGGGTWNLSDFSTAGKLALRDLDWQIQPFPVRNAAASARFTIGSRQITVSQIQAQALGGEISGQAEVTNWRAPAAKSTKVFGEQKGIVNLRFKNLEIGQIASALASLARPLNRLRLAGSATGSLQTRWIGSLSKAEADLTVDVAAPAHFLAGQLPLRGHGQAAYRSAVQELEIHDLKAATPATEVRAQGILSARSAMRFSFRTTDLSEWQAELPGLGYQEQIPVTLQGRASFEGTATGSISAIQFTGRLESQNFDFVMPATSRVPQKQIQWDTLTADLLLSPGGVAAHNGTLRHGDTIVNFDGTAGLHNREFSSSSPFAVRLSVKDADITAVQHLAGYDYPISGRASFLLEASGTQEAPQGTGRLEITNAVIYGQPVSHLESNLQFAGHQITAQDVKVIYYGTPIDGAGTFDLSTHAFHFSAKGGDFDLQRFRQLQSNRFTVEGKLDFVAQGDGTLEAPVLNAEAHVHGLTLDHELAGDYILNAVTKGSDMHVIGRSDFKDSALDLDGAVALRENWLSDIGMRFNHLNVDALLRTYLHGQLTGHSATTGEIHLTGPLRSPRQLQVAGNLSSFSADVEHIQVQNNGPILFAVSGEVLSIRQLRLTGQGTDLSVVGSLQLNGDRLLKLHASGNANLQLIESFNPDFTGSGTVTTDVDLGGTIVRPSIQGQVRVHNGAVAYSGLSVGLSDLNGSLAFTQDRLQVDTLTAQVGGGTVSVGGYISAYSKQLSYDLTLQGRDMRIRYQPGVSSVMNMDLRFVGRSSAATLSGEATITRFVLAPGFDFASYVASTAQSSPLPPTNPLLNQIHLDLHIVTLPELKMQTASARLSGEADLRVRGTAAKPVVLGRADVTEGQISLNGANYRVERGEVTFTNPVTTTPVLDLQASTRVQYYDITVNLNGGFDKLNMSYHSEPPLPSTEIINLLALGQTREESQQLQATGQQSYAAQASTAALAEALNAALSNRSRSLFGISHIKIDPQGLSTTTSPTTTAPAVTIEQQVKDNLTLTYATSVSQTQQQIIQAEYNLSKKMSIVALRDYNGVVSFELRVRQRRK
jgi:translocation and assembly module TamB